MARSTSHLQQGRPLHRLQRMVTRVDVARHYHGQRDNVAVHAVVVYILAGFCRSQLGSVISDRKTVFWHHGRIYLGWEACLKRIRARLQTHDLVGVAFVNRVWMRRRIDSSATPTRGSTACKSIRSFVSFFCKETHDVDRCPVSVSMRLSILATAANC